MNRRKRHYTIDNLIFGPLILFIAIIIKLVVCLYYFLF